MTSGCGCRPYDGGRCNKKVRRSPSDVIVLLLSPVACCGVVQVMGGCVGVVFVFGAKGFCTRTPCGRLVRATVATVYTTKLKIISSENVTPLTSIKRPVRRERLNGLLNGSMQIAFPVTN